MIGWEGWAAGHLDNGMTDSIEQGSTDGALRLGTGRQSMVHATVTQLPQAFPIARLLALPILLIIYIIYNHASCWHPTRPVGLEPQYSMLYVNRKDYLFWEMRESIS